MKEEKEESEEESEDEEEEESDEESEEEESEESESSTDDEDLTPYERAENKIMVNIILRKFKVLGWIEREAKKKTDSLCKQCRPRSDFFLGCCCCCVFVLRPR